MSFFANFSSPFQSTLTIKQFLQLPTVRQPSPATLPASPAVSSRHHAQLQRTVFVANIVRTISNYYCFSTSRHKEHVPILLSSPHPVNHKCIKKGCPQTALWQNWVEETIRLEELGMYPQRKKLVCASANGSILFKIVPPNAPTGCDTRKGQH